MLPPVLHLLRAYASAHGLARRPPLPKCSAETPPSSGPGPTQFRSSRFRSDGPMNFVCNGVNSHVNKL